MPISAAEERPGAPPLCPALDALWLHCAAAGLAALGRADRHEAELFWQAGRSLCRGFPPDDPRHAASLLQLGLAAPDATKALDLLGRADAAWQAVRATWLARLPAGGRARSSTFHLRLGRKHAGGYDNLARAEHERLAEAGRAAVLGSLARALCALGRMDEAVALVDEALASRRAGLGHRESGVATLLRQRAVIAVARDEPAEAQRLTDAATAIEADPVRYDAARLARETGPRFDDLWRLRAAIYLSPIASALPWPRL